jgi:hypothetical protein
MAVKVSCGLQKKIGQPDYGSLGASCQVEFEIDVSLIESNLEAFHQKIASAFAACQTSVEQQLDKHKANGTRLNGHSEVTIHRNGTHYNGYERSGDSRGSTNGRTGTRTESSITQSQLRAIFAISKRRQIDSQAMIRERFGKHRLDDLTIREASALIDELTQTTVEARP